MVKVVKKEGAMVRFFHRNHEHDLAVFLATWLILLSGIFFNVGSLTGAVVGVNSASVRSFTSSGFLLLGAALMVMLLCYRRVLRQRLRLL